MKEWRYSPSLLDLVTRWRWVVSFTPLPLYLLGNEPPVPIGWEAGWAPEPVYTLWKREKSCTAGNQTWAVQPVAHHYTDSPLNVILPYMSRSPKWFLSWKMSVIWKFTCVLPREIWALLLVVVRDEHPNCTSPQFKSGIKGNGKGNCPCA
jgi:hypothetical protein